MTYLLVDVGYLFFYRYHATKLWYKKAHTYTDDLEMVNDVNFANTYQKKIEGCVADLVKKHKTTWDKVIFCRDGRQKNIWRNQLHSEYKGTRDNSALTGLAKAAYLLRLTLFHLVRTRNAKSIGVSTAEADDIVYASINVIRELDPTCPIVIVASDHDYYQILSENINLVGLDKKNHMLQSTRYTEGLSTTEAQRVDLLVKIISGDPSDNIKPIFPRCGKKTALKLALDNTLLESWFTKHPSSKQSFIDNKRLIDMSLIPTELLDIITSKIKISLRLT